MRNLTSGFRNRLSFNDRPTGAGSATGANAMGMGGGRLRSVVSFGLVDVHIFTNGEAASFAFLAKSNFKEKRFGSVEEVTDHLNGIENKPHIIFIVWEEALEAEKLKELVNLGTAKCDFFRAATATADENATEVQDTHVHLPSNRRDLEITGKRMLKAAQDAGHKVTRVPIHI